MDRRGENKMNFDIKELAQYCIIFIVVGLVLQFFSIPFANHLNTVMTVDSEFTKNGNCQRYDGMFRDTYYLCEEQGQLVRYQPKWNGDEYKILKVKQ